MAATLIGFYDALGGPAGDVQVLCATTADQPWGMAGINRLLHERAVGEGGDPVRLFGGRFG
jgi:hypothetical protein